MVSSSQIREQLERYLANRFNLAQFEDWFIPNTRDIRKTRSDAAIELTQEIEAALSEFLSHVTSEAEFRSELQYLVHRDTYEFVHYDVPNPIFANSAPQFKTVSPLRFVSARS